MILFPLVLRELQAESRRPINYLLRLVGAGLALAVFVTMPLKSLPPQTAGLSLFAALNFALFAGIWIAVPLMTADCISQERREGTLGLLFLTPLKPIEVALAKVCSQALKALTLLLAATPVLIVPVLLGGVTWMDVTRATLLNLGAMLLALCCGLLASAHARKWGVAVFLAFAYCLAGAILFGGIYAMLKFHQGGVRPGRTSWIEGLGYAPGFLVQRLGRLINMLTGSYETMFTWTNVSSPASLALAVVTFLAALLLALFVLFRTARAIAGCWRESPPSALREQIEKTMFTPVLFTAWLPTLSRHGLHANPIAWLGGHSAKTRSSAWFLALLVIIWETFSVATWGLPNLQQWFNQHILVFGLLYGLGGIVTANRFHAARDDGSLQLLLVTPVGDRKLMFGLISSAWRVVRWAVALALFSFVLGSHFSLGSHYYYSAPTRTVLPGLLAVCATSAVIIPGLSLAAALFSRSSLACSAFALLVSVGIPGLVIASMVRSTQSWSRIVYWSTWSLALLAAVQIFLGLAAWWVLSSQLRKRSLPSS